MRVENVVTFPGLWFAGRELAPPRTEWRVMLNKREQDTLRRAAAILEEARQLVDPNGNEEWSHPYATLSCAEAWVSEAAECGGSFPVNTWNGG